MNETKFIHLEPGQTAIIKMADSPSTEIISYSISHCAKLLGIHRTTLYRKLKKLDIIPNRDIPNNPRLSHEQFLKLKK